MKNALFLTTVWVMASTEVYGQEKIRIPKHHIQQQQEQEEEEPQDDRAYLRSVLNKLYIRDAVLEAQTELDKLHHQDDSQEEEDEDATSATKSAYESYKQQQLPVVTDNTDEEENPVDAAFGDILESLNDMLGSLNDLTAQLEQLYGGDNAEEAKEEADGKEENPNEMDSMSLFYRLQELSNGGDTAESAEEAKEESDQKEEDPNEIDNMSLFYRLQELSTQLEKYEENENFETVTSSSSSSDSSSSDSEDDDDDDDPLRDDDDDAWIWKEDIYTKDGKKLEDGKKLKSDDSDEAVFVSNGCCCTGCVLHFCQVWVVCSRHLTRTYPSFYIFVCCETQVKVMHKMLWDKLAAEKGDDKSK